MRRGVRRGVRRARTAVLSCLLVGGLGLTTACSGGAAPTEVESTSGPSTPAAEATTGSSQGASVTTLSAAGYRSAMRILVGADTATFEQVVVTEDGSDDPALAPLPRSSGSWRISADEFEQSTLSLMEDGSPVELGLRTIGTHVFTRFAFEGSMFGTDCWSRIAQGIEVPDGSQVGIPPALQLLFDYRPDGRPGAGTVPLADALGAIGFQKVVNTNLVALRGARVRVDVQLTGDTFHRALIYTSDLTHALAAVTSDSAGLDTLDTLLATASPYFWGIQYADFGAPVTIEAPPAAKILPIDGQETCDS